MHAYGDDTLVRAVLDDHTSADIPSQLKATLDFLQKLTLDPWQLTSADVAPLRALGLQDEAIIEAMGVCMVFSVLVRLADALDFDLADEQQLRMNAFFLLKLGYHVSVVPG